MTDEKENDPKSVARRIVQKVRDHKPDRPGDEDRLLVSVTDEIVECKLDIRRMEFPGAALAKVENDNVLFDMERPVPLHRYEGEKPPYPEFARPFRNPSAFPDGQTKDERHTNLCVGCSSFLPSGHRKEIVNTKAMQLERLFYFQVFVGPLDPKIRCLKFELHGPLWKPVA